MDVGKVDRKRMWQVVSIILIGLYAVMFVLDWKFSLALFPLILVVVGMVVFRLGGATMAVIGWVVAVILAVVAFRTDLQVAILASIEGLLKSLGIGVAVIFTMYLIFLMKEQGLLATVSSSLKRVAKTKEEQALFIGIGFGTFATSLGIVTPALFPPLLLAMGFTPLGAVAIAVLGYNASTSFALLSLPITLPADVSPGLTDGTGFSGIEFAFFICLFLPVISIAISYAMLYIIGGKESVRKGTVPAFIVGAAVAFSCLGFVAYEYLTGNTAVPLRVVGVVAGLLSMGALYGYQVGLDRWRDKRGVEVVEERFNAEEDSERPIDWPTVLRAYSPLIILTVLAAIVGIKSVSEFLADLPGDWEVIKVAENKVVDLNILAQIYTWILVAIIISILYLRPKREVLVNTNKVWVRRIWSPFIAYSVFFAIAYVMAYSAMRMQDGAIVPSDHFDDFNMNVVMAAGLAAAFGTGYMWISSSLGLFGAIVGGSETGSNVLFMNVQYNTADQVGMLDASDGMINDRFMAMYGGHGVAGGVASAITPSKVNNAVVTIGEGAEMEAQVMSKLLLVTIILMVVINVMTGIFVSLF
jgi:lactate permease